MMEKMIEKLERMLTKKRFIHSMGTYETAIKLAKAHSADVEKAAMSGLLHDCAKNLTKEEALSLCYIHNIILDDVEKIETGLIHAKTGAWICEHDFGVSDPEILSAIRYHTTGKDDMSLLEKITYLADYIEPNRNFRGIFSESELKEQDELKRLAYVDLDSALVISFDISIRRVIEKGMLIHPNTIKGRNFIINDLRNRQNV